MLRPKDVVSRKHRLLVGTCVLLASQASCVLIGYEGTHGPAIGADAGTMDDRPDDGLDASQDSALPARIDSGVAGVDAAASQDASRVDKADGNVAVDPMPRLDASGGDASPGDASASDASKGETSPADASNADATTPAVDSGVTVNPPIPGCLGTPALGLCWHLGSYGLSCDETCDTNYGGFDPGTIKYTGKPSEGVGTLANCQTVLVALGITTVPTASYRADGLGLGCHVALNGTSWWLDDRQGPFDAGDSLFGVRRACACVH